MPDEAIDRKTQEKKREKTLFKHSFVSLFLFIPGCDDFRFPHFSLHLLSLLLSSFLATIQNKFFLLADSGTSSRHLSPMKWGFISFTAERIRALILKWKTCLWDNLLIGTASTFSAFILAQISILVLTLSCLPKKPFHTIFTFFLLPDSVVEKRRELGHA